jgi:stage V sporulation protein D (sporulation-specific penicillin-binding protein)
MGYAPADDPQIAIYVVVDRPNAAKQDDAKFATGIVRNILTEVLPYMNIFMTEELSDAEKQELEELHLEITTQYTQTPEEDAIENLDEDSQEEQTSEEGEEQEQNVEPVWKSFPIDPDTGYRVDPETGEQYDAETGVAIEGGSSMGEGIPSNPNLTNPSDTQ